MKKSYEIYHVELMGNSGDMKRVSPFNLDMDIALKDCYMDVYIKQRKNVGIKFVYF